jgi:hypothetical protein
MRTWERERLEISDLDPNGDARHTIAFTPLARAREPFLVPVGACSQWTGYAGDTLYLRAPRPRAVTAIRLLPGPAQPHVLAGAGGP